MPIMWPECIRSWVKWALYLDMLGRQSFESKIEEVCGTVSRAAFVAVFCTSSVANKSKTRKNSDCELKMQWVIKTS